MDNRTSEQWLEIMKQWQQSGISQRKYCAKMEIPHQLFHLRRSQFIALGAVKPVSPKHNLKPKNPLPMDSQPQGFVSLLSNAAPLKEKMITIELPHGITIRISDHALS